MGQSIRRDDCLRNREIVTVFLVAGRKWPGAPARGIGLATLRLRNYARAAGRWNAHGRRDARARPVTRQAGSTGPAVDGRAASVTYAAAEPRAAGFSHRLRFADALVGRARITRAVGGCRASLAEDASGARPATAVDVGLESVQHLVCAGRERWIGTHHARRAIERSTVGGNQAALVVVAGRADTAAAIRTCLAGALDLVRAGVRNRSIFNRHNVTRVGPAAGAACASRSARNPSAVRGTTGVRTDAAAGRTLAAGAALAAATALVDRAPSSTVSGRNARFRPLDVVVWSARGTGSKKHRGAQHPTDSCCANH